MSHYYVQLPPWDHKYLAHALAFSPHVTLSYLKWLPITPLPLTQIPDSWTTVLPSEFARQVWVTVWIIINRFIKTKADGLRDYRVPGSVCVIPFNPYQLWEMNVIILMEQEDSGSLGKWWLAQGHTHSKRKSNLADSLHSALFCWLFLVLSNPWLQGQVPVPSPTSHIKMPMALKALETGVFKRDVRICVE